MVKGELNDRPKATKEQMRIAQVTQEPTNETIVFSHVRKVMELTRCTQQDAEFALLDHNNVIDDAVLAVLDRPENGSSWKESKGRKAKKQDTNDRDDYYGNNRRSDATRGTGNRGRNNFQGRGGGNNARMARQQPQGQEPRKDRVPQGQSNRGASTNNARGGRHYNNNNGKEKAQEEDQNKFPAVDSFSAELSSKDDENTWKNGPLVFEKSVQPVYPAAAAVTAAPTPPKNDKPTFAAVAASKKAVAPPPPPPVVQPPLAVNREFTEKLKSDIGATPSVSSVSQISSSPAIENNKLEFNEVASPIRQFSSSTIDQKESSPSSLVTTSHASTSFGPAAVDVNKEFTDKLKNDIGLRSSVMTAPSVVNSVNAQQPDVTSHYSTENPTTRANAMLHDVEFVSGDVGPSILDFSFGFHSDVPASHDERQSNGRDAAALSMVNTDSVSVVSQPGSEDLRFSANNSNQKLAHQSNNNHQQQQQQPSAQQQHNSLQQQQQQMYAAAAAAQFPGYAIPYLYSPVASNMNSMRDVDQLNSYTPLNPFQYGLNQLDMQMSAMLPPSMQSANAQTGALNVATQSHQQNSNNSQQHRGPPADSKFQQGNVNTSNGLQSNASYQNLGVNSQSNQLRNQNNLDNGAGTGANTVAPPPGFSGPPFLTQPSFQSLFQSYTHPAQMSIPYFLQGNNQQRQPQSQQQQHHQRPNEHGSYMDLKYQQQANLGSTANNAPTGNTNYGAGGQTGQRNQLAGTGAMDNGLQYYNPSQATKWSGGNGGWRA